ncbi:hypothetical protein PV328_006380 [Microctonus aethiopoides]|uniref:Uncharacterized protein n=1 Tax=Microctonus aethiopoides TaxID=144406 RepID=A0AA39FNY8_9HYME|nr:hypothetical protein PV328_006380 [Microctonus aethiopoides]
MAIKNSGKNIYLIGYELKVLSQRKLPTIREVLSLLMYNHNSLRKPLNESVRIVVNEVKSVWSKTKIPVMNDSSIVRKLKKLYDKWIKVKKNMLRTKSITQKIKEADFKLLSQKLFDIANQNKNICLTNEQTIFLDNERKNQGRGRRGIIPFDLEETNSNSEEPVEELIPHLEK